MKPIRFMSAAALLLLFGIATPAHAQQEKQQEKAKPAQQQQQPRQQQARSSQAPQRTEEAVDRQRSQPALRLSSRGGGRISDDRFRSHFGREHEFHMGNPVLVGGYSRFQYNGFWFGFLNHGRMAGITPTTSTSITSTVNITCTTRTIPAHASQSAWSFSPAC
jgi:hypothetical protein